MRFEVHLTNQAMAGDPKLLQPAPTKENICAVVVTYFPNEEMSYRLSRIHAQVDCVLVVDNTSSDTRPKCLGTFLPAPNVDIIRNCANLGIAAALNQGVRWAMQKGYAWVLFFDQDTIPFSDMVERLGAVYAEFPSKDRLAIIGSNHYVNSPPDRSPSATSSWVESKTVITSGSLLSLEAARIAGSFRDEFFIDCVDLEYCLRLRSMGFEVVETLEPLMQHSIGRPTRHRLAWKGALTSNHTPWRWYYMTRNNLVLLREYLWKDPAWVFERTEEQIRWVLFMLLFEESKLLKLKYMALGFYDGITGRFGWRFPVRD